MYFPLFASSSFFAPQLQVFLYRIRSQTTR